MKPSKPKPKRGDIILVLFPHSDLQKAKPRHALVVQADDLNTGMEQLIIKPLGANLSQ
jgi:mRNA interferase MazF